MAVGKGSIQRATRALKEEKQEKGMFTEQKPEETTPAPGVEAETAATETEAAATEAENPVSSAAEEETKTKPAAKKAPAKRGRKATASAKEEKPAKAPAKAGTRKPAAKKSAAGDAAPAKKRGRKPGSKNTAKPAASPAPSEEKTYTQVSHIYSALPVHLL